MAAVGTVELVVDLARSLGVSVDEPVLLRSTNNILAWLRPSMVVAKIATRPDTAGRELALAQALELAGAPIVPPAPEIGGCMHRVDGFDVTFWKYEPQEPTVVANPQLIALALHELHEALSPVGSVIPLHSYDIAVADAIRCLEDVQFAPDLRAEDREILLRVLRSGSSSLPMLSDTGRVIHGSPHRLNILLVAGRPCFIDFETVELGPVEWDVAHLEPAVASHYPGHLDGETLAHCRMMISATTSTWCWGALERGPDMRDHAERHLAVIRSTVG